MITPERPSTLSRGIQWPFGCTFSVPRMPTGTTGTPACIAEPGDAGAARDRGGRPATACPPERCRRVHRTCNTGTAASRACSAARPPSRCTGIVPRPCIRLAISLALEPGQVEIVLLGPVVHLAVDNRDRGTARRRRTGGSRRGSRRRYAGRSNEPFDLRQVSVLQRTCRPSACRRRTAVSLASPQLLLEPAGFRTTGGVGYLSRSRSDNGMPAQVWSATAVGTAHDAGYRNRAASAAA